MKKDLYCLIIEDNIDIRETLKEHVSRLGIFKNVVLAADGLEGQVKISNQKFDLVLSDISLPKKNGAVLMIQEINLRTVSPESVIMLSGSMDTEIVLQLIASGVKHFLTKPMSLNALNDKIKVIASQTRK